MDCSVPSDQEKRQSTAHVSQAQPTKRAVLGRFLDASQLQTRLKAFKWIP